MGILFSIISIIYINLIFHIILIFCFSFLFNKEGSEEAYIEDILDIDKIALEQIQEGEERVEELADENEKINEKNNEIIENEKSDLDNTRTKTMINDDVNEKQQKIDNEKELVKQIQKAECIAETFENVKIFPILGNCIKICAYTRRYIDVYKNVCIDTYICKCK